MAVHLKLSVIEERFKYMFLDINQMAVHFSSPEPEALGSLWDGTRAGVCASISASFHTFKHEYLWDQQAQADWKQILSGASLWWGEAT